MNFFRSHATLFFAFMVMFLSSELTDNSFAALVEFKGDIAGKPSDVLSPSSGKTTSFTNSAAIQLNLTNFQQREALFRLRVYDENNSEIRFKTSLENFLVRAGESKQVIIIFAITNAQKQRMRICAQQHSVMRQWNEKFCGHYQVMRMR